jgi:CRP-like cAMP-binding protein
LESLQGFDDQCLGFIASRLRQAAFTCGETIFKRGERGDEMFLILEGAVVVHAGPQPPTAPVDEPERNVQRLLAHGGSTRNLKVDAEGLAVGERVAGKGDVFGESVLFPEELSPFRLESAKALSFVSAFVLTANSMQDIKLEYPMVSSCTLPHTH